LSASVRGELIICFFGDRWRFNHGTANSRRAAITTSAITVRKVSNKQEHFIKERLTMLRCTSAF
jgi:hypothetical protein